MNLNAQFENSLVTALKSSPVDMLAILRRALVAASNHWTESAPSGRAAEAIDTLVAEANKQLEALVHHRDPGWPPRVAQ